MKPYILGIIVIGILLVIGFYLFQESKPVEEGFATRNVNLNFCPLFAPQIQTAKGNTDCCEGTLLDGKCSAKTFCTLSPPYGDVKSCLDAWRKYFIDKSIQQCPTTMPNYFEDVRTPGKEVGCSQSGINQDGKQPTNGSAPRCRFYPTERQNQEEMDSCFIEKEKLKVRCPRYPGYRSVIEKVRSPQGKFGSFVCVYTNTIGDRRSCNDEKSLVAMWDRENPNWRMDRNKTNQLQNVSCRTFIAREGQRRRLEELRRRAEEEKRKREEQANRFRNFFSGWRDRMRRAQEDARRRAEEQRRAAARRLQELQNRLRRCR